MKGTGGEELTMLGFLFTRSAALPDGRPFPPAGEWDVQQGPVNCESGLHASEQPFEALALANGTVLSRVELEGELVRDRYYAERWHGQRLRVLGTLDATELLWEFARWCAEQVAGLWAAPAVVLDYLRTGDESQREAARAAAWAASRAAELAADSATRAVGQDDDNDDARPAQDRVGFPRNATEGPGRLSARPNGPAAPGGFLAGGAEVERAALRATGTDDAWAVAAAEAAAYAASAAEIAADNKLAATVAARAAAQDAAEAAAQAAGRDAADAAAKAALAAQRAKLLELVEAAFAKEEAAT